MLQAQVNYWTLVETARHNLVTEAISYNSLQETIRHNVQTESIGWETLAETKRHNVVSEAQGWESLSIQSYNAETNRFNAVENHRHNVVTEQTAWFNAESQRLQAYAAQQQASAAMQNAYTNYQGMINQASRWNAMTVNEQAKQQETQRYNTAMIKYKDREVAVKEQEARTGLYNTYLKAAELKVDTKTNVWNTIERFVPDVPFTLMIPGGKTGR